MKQKQFNNIYIYSIIKVPLFNLIITQKSECKDEKDYER